MISYVQLLDILSFSIVFIIGVIILSLAWMSTYVREQRIYATVVLVPQDSSNNTTLQAEMSSPTSSNNENASTSQNLTQTDRSFQERHINSEVEVAESNSSLVQNGDGTKEAGTEASTYVVPSDCDREVDSVTIVPQVIAESTTALPEEAKTASATSVVRKRRTNDTDASEKLNVDENNPSLSCDSTEIKEKEEIHCENILQEPSVRIKLKFFDETQRLVMTQLTEEIGNFKRANFDNELSSHCIVQLIFNGQLLNRDGKTLGACGLFDNCVVHCHVSEPRPEGQASLESRSARERNQQIEGLDLSEFLSPLLLVTVGLVWYLRYEYAHIFNTFSTIVLVMLTVLFLISQLAVTVSLVPQFFRTLRFTNATDEDGRPTPSAPVIELNDVRAPQSAPIIDDVADEAFGSETVSSPPSPSDSDKPTDLASLESQSEAQMTSLSSCGQENRTESTQEDQPIGDSSSKSRVVLSS